MIINVREALWVQVLRYKYGCGNLTIPYMKCSSRPSHLWRDIVQYWPLVEKKCFIGCKEWVGDTVLDDQWVPEYGSLREHMMVAISGFDSQQTINAFATNGEWNWSLLHQLLPPPICTKIASIRAPSFHCSR